MHMRDKANQSKLRPDIPQEMKTERKYGTHVQQRFIHLETRMKSLYLQQEE